MQKKPVATAGLVGAAGVRRGPGASRRTAYERRFTAGLQGGEVGERDPGIRDRLCRCDQGAMGPGQRAACRRTGDSDAGK